jgi:predicted DNA-binding transcriptional regulator AlpA
MPPIQPEMLTAAEVAQMLGMERTSFYRFRQARPDFPRPVVLYKTAKGRPVERWRRREVLAFIDLLAAG